MRSGNGLIKTYLAGIPSCCGAETCQYYLMAYSLPSVPRQFFKSNENSARLCWEISEYFARVFINFPCAQLFADKSLGLAHTPVAINKPPILIDAQTFID
jgi:hypothetical protein